MKLKICQVSPDPDQPRKLFEKAALAELAASITENGLLQPISVRQTGPDAYIIIAGERRYRAHLLANMVDIEANVVEGGDHEILAMVENLQRSDITPLEEAFAFKRQIDHGYTPESLAHRLGIKQPHRISDRLQLLDLNHAYLDLLEKGHLTPSQGFELSRLGPQDQDRLFKMIGDGRCDTYAKLRAAADGFMMAASQSSMFDDDGPKVTAQEASLLTAFEKKIASLVILVGAGFKDGELVVLKKINPHRAAIAVDQLDLISRHVKMMQRELQMASTQSDLSLKAA